MVWWGWLVIGVLIALVVTLVIFLIRKKPAIIGFTQDEKDALASAATKQTKQELAAEKEKTVKLALLNKVQKEKLEELKLWYDGVKEKIDDQRKKDFEKFISSDDDLIAELDQQLGISTSQGDKPE